VARAGRVLSWEEFAQRNPDLLRWKEGVLWAFYRRETLDSELARHVFVMPDVMSERLETSWPPGA
jgi:hypothetical protein